MPALSSLALRIGLDTRLRLDGQGAPVLDTEAGETITSSTPDVDLLLGEEPSPSGRGTLHVTTKRVVWVERRADGAEPAVLGISYQQIVMHAVSTDPELSSRPCIYLQLDEGSEGMPEEEEEEDAESVVPAELRLVPLDAAHVEEVFKHMCDGAALNPDSQEEDDGQAELFFDEAEVMAGLPAEARAALLAGQAAQGLALDDVDELMADDPDRFEDDEEEEEEHAADPAAGVPNGV